jgi:hypothetical protein
LYLAAIALGVGSAWLALRGAMSFGQSAGPWAFSTSTGSTDADLYTRARVALGGLLALNRDETMYYLATTDSAGRALRSRCTYRVSGVPPKARWWSVTAYADDFFLFPHPSRRYSLNGATASLDGQGRFTLVSAPAEPGGSGGLGASAGSGGASGAAHWLPTPGDRGLMFTLRVYNPDSGLIAAPASLEPPLIERLGDC